MDDIPGTIGGEPLDDGIPSGGARAQRGTAEFQESIGNGLKRDRLMAALTLIAGIGLLLALPFALQAGSPFFLPLTAALVIAIALVPLLEWLERHRVPAPLAALTCVLLFLVAANVALRSMVMPTWLVTLPCGNRAGQRIKHGTRIPPSQSVDL